MSHTPGTWKFHEYLDHNENIQTGVISDRSVIYVVVGTSPEDRANARLIAAAPDMYEALEAIQALSGPVRIATHEKAFALCIAALAKARGEK